jgi:steroid 5-alpha reductase family enzyme
MAHRTTDFLRIISAYAVALLAAMLTLHLTPLAAPWDALLADIVATVVIFCFSRYYKNSSVYDAYWSVAPPLLAILWLWQWMDVVNPQRAWLIIGLVTLWGIRLTANWALHWQGMHHEDWRYPLVRQRAGRFAWLADFWGIHVFPTLVVFLGCLPIYAIMRYGGAPLTIADMLAALLTLTAISIELIADIQLHRFIAQKQKGQVTDTFIQSGLWSWSRHPNYFGEMMFWWGILACGLAAIVQWWMFLGAISIALMFFLASIPFMDQRSLERRAGYRDYMQHTASIIPWRRKTL